MREEAQMLDKRERERKKAEGTCRYKRDRPTFLTWPPGLAGFMIVQIVQRKAGKDVAGLERVEKWKVSAGQLG